MRALFVVNCCRVFLLFCWRSRAELRLSETAGGAPGPPARGGGGVAEETERHRRSNEKAKRRGRSLSFPFSPRVLIRKQKTCPRQPREEERKKSESERERESAVSSDGATSAQAQEHREGGTPGGRRSLSRRTCSAGREPVAPDRARRCRSIQSRRVFPLRFPSPRGAANTTAKQLKRGRRESSLSLFAFSSALGPRPTSPPPRKKTSPYLICSLSAASQCEVKPARASETSAASASLDTLASSGLT